jgi:two-component system, cell cycle sensor histidine kinase and response regulator CckA
MFKWRRKPKRSKVIAQPPPVVSAEAAAASKYQLDLLNRAHQQAAVSALGQQALTGADINTLLEHATLFITQTLSVEFAIVHQLEADGETVRTVAAAGLPTASLSQPISARANSMARYVLDAAEPVIVRDLRTMARFEVPPLLRRIGAISGLSVVIRLPQGAWGLLHAYTIRLRTFGEDDFHFLQSVANIISTAYGRRKAEEENAKLAAFAQFNPNPVLEFNTAGELTNCNEATKLLMEALGGSNPTELLPSDAPEALRRALATGHSEMDVEVEICGRTISWSYFPITSIGRVHAYAVDVTDRLNLEAQLRQAQKMEAIGQLAAGVAHDFNNILTIMQGLVRKMGNNPVDPAETLQQLYDTTERAAAFTRQLLAFSRRQVLQSRVIDVREVTACVSKMLQRLIGEDIVLTVTGAPDLPMIEADPSMMEQILLNLAVNGRDAMPRGGQLIISTDAVTLPDGPGATRDYVRLCVQDTGCGMTEEIQARIFEPFFTTKEVGKGTGLGLATVFGIVKQHNGSIEVQSEVGIGTTFTIFLPATDKKRETPVVVPEAPAAPPAGGNETILLVEDEPLLRELAQMVLTGSGYTVLEAGDCDQAMDLWREHEEGINLLLTDMVLPGGMNGRDLAQMLQRKKPSLKVIYTTGYSPDIVEAELRPENFLQKPYPPETLIRSVRLCLDQAASTMAR